jgi:hypothetical protein
LTLSNHEFCLLTTSLTLALVLYSSNNTSTQSGIHEVEKRWFASDDAAARVMAARSVADDGIDVDDPAGAAAISDDAASSMLEKGNRNKN